MKKDISYILNHLGEEREKYYNSVSPPIIQSSNFAFDSFDAFREALSDQENKHIYTRGNNPTVEILRKKVAALEGTEDALAFSSGSGAIASAILPFLVAGDHVLCVENPYSWTKTLLSEIITRFDIKVSYVDGRDISSIAEGCTDRTKLLFLESPNSGTFELQDLEACANFCKERGIISMIDNSYCSPIFQNPAMFGIDLIIHAGTKYLNGHSDVMCGFVCGSSELISKVFHFSTMTLGNILSPSDAALVLRGLRTLDLRMHRSHETTERVIEFLASHEKVVKIIYPWSDDFPQKTLARKQMSGAGGLFSVELATRDVRAVEKFCQSLEAFLFAVSWGGHESLVLPYAAFGDDDHVDKSMSMNLVRFYIGLEDADYLISDIKQALELI